MSQMERIDLVMTLHSLVDICRDPDLTKYVEKFMQEGAMESKQYEAIIVAYFNLRTAAASWIGVFEKLHELSPARRSICLHLLDDRHLAEQLSDLCNRLRYSTCPSRSLAILKSHQQAISELRSSLNQFGHSSAGGRRS